MNAKQIDQTLPSIKKPSSLIATWFGCGLLKPAPGTWGSLGSIPPAILLYTLFGTFPFVCVLIAITPIAFWATNLYEKNSGTHDNKRIVIDEVLGQWIALLPVFYAPSLIDNFSGIIWWLFITASFILFRIFDILKPWPISYCDQKIDGATGVILDDIVAGLFAAILIAGSLYAYVNII